MHELEACRRPGSTQVVPFLGEATQDVLRLRDRRRIARNHDSAHTVIGIRCRPRHVVRLEADEALVSLGEQDERRDRNRQQQRVELHSVLVFDSGKLREQPASRAIGRHKSLQSLARENFARVDIALGVDGDHVQTEKLSGLIAHRAHAADDLTRVPIEEPDMVVRQVRYI